MKTGRLVPKIREISQDEIPKGLKELEEGKVQGRLVAVYEKLIYSFKKIKHQFIKLGVFLLLGIFLGYIF